MRHLKFFSLLIAITCFAMTSCNNANDNKPKDSEKAADKANEAKTETNRSEEDASLFVNAVSSDYFEVASAEVASTMATQASVKEYAGMMMAIHKTMMDETKMLAGKKAFTVPGAMANDYMTNIEDMKKWTKGKEFDTKYINGQIDQHKKILDNLEKRMAATADTDIKAWTEKASSEVRKHLDRANMIKEELGKKYK